MHCRSLAQDTASPGRPMLRDHITQAHASIPLCARARRGRCVHSSWQVLLHQLHIAHSSYCIVYVSRQYTFFVHVFYALRATCFRQLYSRFMLSLVPSFHWNFMPNHLLGALWPDFGPCASKICTHHRHLSIPYLQNQAVRIITNGDFFTNASPVLRDRNILHITCFYSYHLSIMFHKLPNKQLLYDFIDSGYLTNNNNTRFAHSSNFLLPMVHTNFGKVTFTA